MKQKVSTKALSALLSLVMVLGLVPGMSMTAYAESAIGIGTIFQIGTVDLGDYYYRQSDVLSRKYYLYRNFGEATISVGSNYSHPSLGKYRVIQIISSTSESLDKEAQSTGIPVGWEKNSSYNYFKVDDYDVTPIGIMINGGSGTEKDPFTFAIVMPYIVTYNTNGGTFIMPITGVNTLPSELPTTTKEGFIFDGWYTDEALVTPAVAGTAISENTTLYAKWKQPISYTVTFKVANGSWDDETATDKTVTLTGYEGDTLKLAADQIPAVGSKPSDTYKAGNWDVTPSTETAITEATTYTYTYAQKDSISRTVTFKVVNGSWNDETTTDKTVTLTGYEGDTLKLAADQIPTVGTKPNDTYKAGSWDVTPSTDTAITEATTYTYTYVAKEASVATKAPKAKTLTYNGQAQELVTAGTATGGEMQYALGNATEATQPYTTSIPTATNAGTYYVWYKVDGGGNYNDSAAACVTVTIAPAPVYDDSSDDSDDDDTISVSVSSDSDSVSVSASVSGSTAAVQRPSASQLDKLISESVHTGEITIDVSAAGKGVTTASIPTETIRAVEQAVNSAANDATGLTVKLPEGSVTLDAQALTAVAEQAKGATIQLNLDGISESRMTGAQRESVQEMDVQAVYDAYMTSNGSRISDFRGGRATVTIPYALKSGQSEKGVVVWYVADNGEKTEMPTSYDGKAASFTTTHFSNYVLVYDAQRAAECPKDDTCPISRFVDADANAWYHDGVHWALESGVMNGVSPKYFNPNGETTRAAFATMLWRMEGSPAATGAVDFVDVDSGMWYAEAVRWASTAGIVTGYKIPADADVWPMGFEPDKAVTREQLAAMLYRYAQYKGADVSVGEDTNILSYNDAFSVSGWATSAMQWAVGSDIINGIGSELVPAGNASRAQVATMLMRYSTK